MNIGLWLSSKGGSPLVIGLERGLKELGHIVTYACHTRACDLVLMFNQCAHTRDYSYPEFPTCKNIAFIDTAEYGYFKRLPGVLENYWNTFTESALNHDTKNRVQQERLKAFLKGKSFPYFAREFFKSYAFPENYHPIDYPLYAHSVCRKTPNREEYLKRDLDLFLSWGASHPWRIHITEALRSCHTKCEIHVLQDDPSKPLVPRMPHKGYFARQEAAKVGVSFDGYGSGSFRMTEVLVRSLLLQGPLSIVRHKPLRHMVHCIEYCVWHDGERFLDTDIHEQLRWALDDPEESFKIYNNGYHHCMSHYTEKATAQYVLDVVGRHDWQRETKIS